LFPSSLHIVRVGKRQIQGAHQIRILVDDFEDVIGGEGLGTQSSLEFREQFGMHAVVGIEE